MRRAADVFQLDEFEVVRVGRVRRRRVRRMIHDFRDEQRRQVRVERRGGRAGPRTRDGRVVAAGRVRVVQIAAARDDTDIVRDHDGPV